MTELALHEGDCSPSASPCSCGAPSAANSGPLLGGACRRAPSAPFIVPFGTHPLIEPGQDLGRFNNQHRLAGATGAPVVLAGDYNVMPTDLDVYRPEHWVDDALFRPEVRDAYARLVSQGWTDALRSRHPGERIYTFWDYFRNAYARDAGLRIDHLLLSPAVADRLTAAGVDRDVRGWEKSSDHAPTWIELADAGKRARPRQHRRS